MKKLLIVTFVIGIGLLLSGCGVTEKIVEKSIESATNNEAKVNFDDNGLTVNTNEGNLQIGEKVSLPENFPSDIYIPDGTITVASVNNNKNSFSISINSNDSVTNIKEKFKSELISNGWTIDSSFDVTGLSSLAGKKDARSVTITMAADEDSGGTIIGIYTDDTK